MIQEQHPTNVPSPKDFPTVPKQLTGPAEKVRQTIAERLAKIRREKGVTQVEMAKKLKTSQSMYSRYESGELRLHADTVVSIAKVLGVTPNEVLGITDGGHVAAEPIEHSIPKRFIRRLKDVDQLTRTDQDALLTMIDAMVSAGLNKQDRKTQATA
jgi:transcriptional regulator with XRE-family HTH domain